MVLHILKGFLKVLHILKVFGNIQVFMVAEVNRPEIEFTQTRLQDHDKVSRSSLGWPQNSRLICFSHFSLQIYLGLLGCTTVPHYFFILKSLSVCVFILKSVCVCVLHMCSSCDVCVQVYMYVYVSIDAQS